MNKYNAGDVIEFTENKGRTWQSGKIVSHEVLISGYWYKIKVKTGGTAYINEMFIRTIEVINEVKQ